MATSMAREKCHPLILNRAHNEGVRRAAERSINVDLFNVRQFGHLIEPAAADYANLCCRHGPVRKSVFLSASRLSYRAKFAVLFRDSA